MPAIVRPLVAPFTAPRTTLRRWAFLLLGATVLLPFAVVGFPLAQTVHQRLLPMIPVEVGLPIGALLVLTGVSFIPTVRVLEVAAVRDALGVDLPTAAAQPARGWPARWRTTGYFLLHLVVGGAIGTLTIITVPMALAFVVAAATGGRVPTFEEPIGEVPPATGPLIGAGILIALAYLVALCGALLAHAAAPLLGPSAADRLAAAQRRVEELAERNRLARELHDSVGHALSVVTLQASAAGRLLDTDPGFARSALGAIEEAGRHALEDLDHVLGVLREDADRAPSPQRTLTHLEALLTTTRAGGAEVDCEVTGELDQVPAAISREAYRIVQEGLTNALRHAGAVPISVRVEVGQHELHLEISNPLGDAHQSTSRETSGRGLRGIAERVAVLHGESSAGADDRRWRLRARLPLRSGVMVR